jgi:hypothetical protein
VAQITTLIDKQDTAEIIRDEIAAILADELANQQALATAAAKDPRLWTIRVFLERSAPWQEYLDPDGTPQIDLPPLVNVTLDALNYNANQSGSVDKQHCSATFHLDVYAAGISENDFSGGHTPGDRRAAVEAQRAVKLIRNILMAGQFTYLGIPFRGIVGSRRFGSIAFFQPQIDARAVQNIVAARMTFEVDFNEFSPQYQPELLELVSVTVKRTGTGEILATADYDYT